MKINKLAIDVQTTLRTGITITDAVQCIVELVQNALDAQSTSVAVRVDLENFILQVVDNGHGLTREELNLVGTRYMTSKCHSLKDLKRNLKYYGFRGESLASLREACGVLMIHSKPKDSNETYTKVFRTNRESHNATVSVHNRLCVGTTVIVKDFLVNLPVRRARIQPAIEIEDIRNALLALSVINYKVSFTLRNDVSKAVILQTKEYKDSGDALKHHCDLKDAHCLIPVSVDIPPFKVAAHISRETEPSGHFQLIYVNGRLVKSKNLYKLVNKKLSKSFYLRNIGKEGKVMSENPKELSFPVYLVNIQCPYIEYDITCDPKKLLVEFRKWDIVAKCLEKIVDKFVSTESNLNVKAHPSTEISEESVPLVQCQNVADAHPIKSNVLFGISVKRHKTQEDYLVSGNNVHNNVEKTVQTCTKNNTPELHKRKKCVEKENDINEDQIIDLASANTLPITLYKKTENENHLQLSVTKSSIRNNISSRSDTVLKSDLENPLPFKVPSNKPYVSKRKWLSEHITTESESDDFTPTNRKFSWDSTISKVKCSGPKVRKSILPITSQQFYSNEIKNMSMVRDILFHRPAITHVESPSQAIQVDVYRSIKECNKDNSLTFTKRNTVKYLNYDKGSYLNCSEDTQSMIIVKSENLCNIKRVNQNEKPKTKDIQRAAAGLNSVHNDSRNHTDKSLLFAQPKYPILHTRNKSCTLKQNWKLFSPRFTNHNNYKGFKPLSIKKIKLNKKSPAVPETHTNNSEIVGYSNKTQKVLRSNNYKTDSNISFCQIKKSNMSFIKPNTKSNIPFKLSVERRQNKSIITQNKSSMKNIHKFREFTENELRKSKNVMNIDSNNHVEFSSNGIYDSDTGHTALRDIRFPCKRNIAEKSDPLPEETQFKFQPEIPSKREYINSETTSKMFNINVDNSDLLYNKKIQNTPRCIFNKSNIPINKRKYIFNDFVNKQSNQLHKNSSFERPGDFKDITHVSCNKSLEVAAFTSDDLIEPSLEEIIISPEQETMQTMNFSPQLHSEFENHLETNKIKNYVILTNKLDKLYLNSDHKASSMFKEDNQTFNDNFSHTNANILDNSNNEETTYLNSKQSYLQTRPNECNGNTEIVIKDKSIITQESEGNIFPCQRQITKFVTPDKKDFSFMKNNENNFSSLNKDNKKSPHITENENLENSLDQGIVINNKTEDDKQLANHNQNIQNVDIKELHRSIKISDWSKVIIPTGKSIYVNLMTGMSSYLTPKEDLNTSYEINNRHWFMPKGTSPLLLLNERNDIVQQLTETEKEVVQNIVSSNNMAELGTIKWKDDQHLAVESVLDILNKSDLRNSWPPRLDFNKPCVFSNESLSTGKVLGQVDSKFIAALLKPCGESNMFLVLFDQHAVDERIRVETLTTGYKQSDGQLVSYPLNPPIEVKLSEHEKAMLTEFLPQMSKLGLKLEVTKVKVLATGIPLCLYNRSARENNEGWIDNMVTILIKQLLASAEDVRGVVPSMPHLLSDIINSEACRGAIKFGDLLTLEQTQVLISKLALCETPFQCAHGRPVLAPLIEIKEPVPKEDLIDLTKLMRRPKKTAATQQMTVGNY